MGMVDQSTPYGSLSYDQTGTYDWTDPYTNEKYSVPTYASNVALSPEGQALQSSNMAAQQNMADTAADRSAFLKDYLGSGAPIDTESLSSYLYDLGSKRLDPRFEQQREQLGAKLANQGITMGSEAYNSEMERLSQSENDAYNQLALTGRGQALSELTTLRNQPINEIIGLLSGTQVQSPGVSMSQPSGMPYTDNAGLINQNYNQQYNNYQQDLASWNNTIGGLFGLGGNIAAAFSDIRLKTDIERVGDQNGLGVYDFRYIWDDPNAPKHRGYMAQEVSLVMPEAVGEFGGYKTLDYSKLPEIE